MKMASTSTVGDRFLGAGDIDRIIIEWRSLLRQVIYVLGGTAG